MSGGILVYAEQSGGTVREAARQVVAAATRVKAGAGGLLEVVVLGDDTAAAAAVDLPGVDEVIVVPVAASAIQPDVVASILEALIADRKPALTLAAFSVDAMAFGARVAVEAGLGFASNVTSVVIDGTNVIATRSVLGGKVLQEAEIPLAGGALVLLRAEGSPLPAEAAGAPVRRHDIALDPTTIRTRHLAYEQAPTDDGGLARAPFILTVGRGVTDRDDLEIFRSLARRVGALLGSTRPLVDSGWMPRTAQVGQSGTTVKPRVYLAFGVSGASEHLAGMRGSEMIIAINTDPRAPIFSVADVGAVADAVEVAEELDRAW